MDKLTDALAPGEAQMAMDLLASSWMERASRPSRKMPAKTERLPSKLYAVMATTSLVTFATLASGYQLFFPHRLFA